MLTHITESGLPALQLTNDHGEALVFLHGAHVARFTPRGAQPVLWMSAKSRYQDGASIRGGIPVCGPWFGPHATDAKLPVHGLLRQRSWQFVRHAVLADGRDQVELSVAADAAMLAVWPHPFTVSLVVTVGRQLDVELSFRNTGTAPFLLGEALHTYLAVSDVRTVRITGLAGATLIDRVDGGARRVQGVEPVAISGEVDRVYFSEDVPTRIEDPGMGRTIVISKRGSGATVLWNPWIEKAKKMADFGDDEWTSMLCVEAANAADATVVVPPSFTHHLGCTIGLA